MAKVGDRPMALMPSSPAAATLIESFAPASVEDVRATALQRRFDRKFVVNQDQFELALAEVEGKYKLLRAGGQAFATYQTVYFDTPAYDLFRQHVRGQKPRYKVRIRHYPDRNLSFLEVKQKNNKGETHKHRLSVPFGQVDLEPEALLFLNSCCPVDPTQLAPALFTDFRRLTLLEPQRAERVTFDVLLRFTGGPVRYDIGRLVIIEVKQGQVSGLTPIRRALRMLRLRPEPFSKYSIGVSLAGLTKRAHAFRPTLKMIERLVHA